MQNRLRSTQTTSSSKRNQHQKIHPLQKTSIATVPIDNAGNTLALARDLGFLDTVPIDRTFSDFVGVSDRQDFYRFKLQADSYVNLNLNGLSANANLFLADAAGQLILSSTNAGKLAEAIATNLISGTYYVLVRPGAGANTNYDLTLSAQFIVDEEIVSDTNIPLPDPEFDPLGSRITWQDKNNNLWVAPVNPETGEFILSEAIALDSNLAPIASYRQRTGSGNGPEWVYTSQDGAEILYTKALGASQDDWLLYRARWAGTEWQVEPLPNADLLPQGENGLSPFGSLNPNDPNPRVFYALPTPVGANSILAWRDLDEPVGGIVGETATFAGSWVNDESSSIVFTKNDSNGIAQIFQYNIDTQALEQLTFSATNKDEPYMWQAPEFNNERVFFAVEKSATESDYIGVYLKQNEVWTQINTLRPPTLKQNIRSAEPFTYNGRSYISFLSEDSKGKNSEVWIASIDPRFEFYRQVSDPNIQMVRNDPESFIGDTGAFIYYAEKGSGIIYRADTGLGLPEQILATTTTNLTIEFNVENILVTNDRSILAAEFIPNDVVVSDPDVSLPDPEFDRISNRITWQDFDNNLYVASIDPVTGDLLLTDGVGELLDTNLVPIFSLANGTGTGNGPEWVYTKDGAEIIYSKQSTAEQWDLGRAQLNETGWQAGLLPGGENGFSPLSSLDPNDETPRAFYLLRTPENPDGIDPKIGAWIDLKDSSKQGELDFEPGSGGRWVEGENSFILTAKDENDIDQIVKYDTDTETYEFLTTDPVKKDDPFMWKAPEFNDELVFFTIENSGSGPTQIGVYREIGGTWTKFKTLDPPSEKKFIDSPEFFVYNDKSYVFFLTQPRQNSKGLSELWLAGIDPDVDFYRELNDPDVDMVRSDPEFFVTESGAYIYYSEIVDDAEKTRIIHRTDTGLGEPVTNERFGSVTEDNLQLPSFFESYLTFTGTGNDTLNAKEEQSPATDRLYAGSDSDLLLAGTNDRLLGGEGNDTLDASSGGGGNRLYGGGGNDLLIAGFDDVLVGGAGVDRFTIAKDSVPNTVNRVADFEVGVEIVAIEGLTIDDRAVSFDDLNIIDGDLGAEVKINLLSVNPIAIFLGISADVLNNVDNFDFS